MKRVLPSASHKTEASSEEDDVGADEDYGPPQKMAKKTKNDRGRGSKLVAEKSTGVATRSMTAAKGPANVATRSSSATKGSKGGATSSKSAAKPTTGAKASKAIRKTITIRLTPENTRTSATKAKSSASASTFGKRIVKNAGLPDAISARARLPACNLGALELLTFFPFHLQWPRLGLRLYRNGWTSLQIAKAQMHARGTMHREDKAQVYSRRSANQHQVKKNGDYVFNVSDFKVSRYRHRLGPTATYDARTYAPRSDARSTLITASLVDIAAGVKEWPKNEDAGIFTKVVAYAVRTNQIHLTTNDVLRIARRRGYQDSPETSGTQWDQNALERSEARIELSGNFDGGKIKYAFEDETDGEDEDAEEGTEDEYDEEDAEEGIAGGADEDSEVADGNAEGDPELDDEGAGNEDDEEVETNDDEDSEEDTEDNDEDGDADYDDIE